MTPKLLHEVVDARIDTLLSAASTDASHARIEADRRLVDALLDNADPPNIYGFTTLLGHLDSMPMTPTGQMSLLRAHLVGSPFEAPPEWMTILTRVKLSQLSAGGSGIHPATFRALSGVAQTAYPHSARGAWTIGYSSGDVVPAAWWLNALIDIGAVELHHPGDLITLINGSFVSTAHAIVAIRAWTRTIDACLAVVREQEQTLPSYADSGIQLPVTMRDLSPLLRSIEHAVSDVLAALEFRLTHPSCNPVFISEGGRAQVRSQSSFLDFTLRDALETALSASVQTSVYLLAAARLRLDHFRPDETTPLQVLKIARSHHRALVSLSARTPMDYSLMESAGIEDVCDWSLSAAITLNEARGYLESELALLTIDSRSNTDERAWDRDDVLTEMSQLFTSSTQMCQM